MWSDCVCARKQQTPYLVRMTKPNPVTSHDWHVQPICQRSLRVDRLSGLLDRDPDYSGVLELVALEQLSSYRTASFSFARLSKNIELSGFCQAQPFLSSGAARPLPAVCSPRSDSGGRLRKLSLLNVAQRKISINNQRTAPEPLRLAGDFSPGNAMVCSLWDSLQGPSVQARIRPFEPTSPLPVGQAVRPLGSSTAHLQLFKSTIALFVLQAFRQSIPPSACCAIFTSRRVAATDCDFLRIATIRLLCNSKPCGKNGFPVGKPANPTPALLSSISITAVQPVPGPSARSQRTASPAPPAINP